MDCACDSRKIQVVHAYLKEHFPTYTLSDFHAQSTATQAGVLTAHAEHHVVSMRHHELPYSTVLMGDFLAQAVEDIGPCLREWNLAAMLAAQRIVIVSKSGVSTL